MGQPLWGSLRRREAVNDPAYGADYDIDDERNDERLWQETQEQPGAKCSEPIQVGRRVARLSDCDGIIRVGTADLF